MDEFNWKLDHRDHVIKIEEAAKQSAMAKIAKEELSKINFRKEAS